MMRDRAIQILIFDNNQLVLNKTLKALKKIITWHVHIKNTLKQLSYSTTGVKISMKNYKLTTLVKLQTMSYKTYIARPKFDFSDHL